MNFNELSRTAKARYGGVRWSAEDPFFNRIVLLDLANHAHRYLAEETHCYRQTQTYNVTSGDGTIELECNVIEILPETVRLSVSGTWTPLKFWHEDRLRYAEGPFENISSGTPWCYYLQTGDTYEQHRLLKLFPAPATTVSSGLKVDAYIYPADFSADTHTSALQPAEHQLLVPILCWKMAEMDAGRGRRDAPVEYWRRQSEEAVNHLRDTVHRFRKPAAGEVRHRSYDDW